MKDPRLEFKNKSDFIKYACTRLTTIHPNQLCSEYGFNQTIALNLCNELQELGYFEKETFVIDGKNCVRWNNKSNYVEPSFFQTILNFFKKKR